MGWFLVESVIMRHPSYYVFSQFTSHIIKNSRMLPKSMPRSLVTIFCPRHWFTPLHTNPFYHFLGEIIPWKLSHVSNMYTLGCVLNHQGYACYNLSTLVQTLLVMSPSINPHSPFIFFLTSFSMYSSTPFKIFDITSTFSFLWRNRS